MLALIPRQVELPRGSSLQLGTGPSEGSRRFKHPARVLLREAWTSWFEKSALLLGGRALIGKGSEVKISHHAFVIFLFDIYSKRVDD